MTQQPQKRVIAPSAPNAAKAKSGGKNKKVTNSLVALSSAAILSVYGLGYVRTNAASALDNLAAPAIAIATAAATPIHNLLRRAGSTRGAGCTTFESDELAGRVCLV